jgi:hypothetical protein
MATARKTTTAAKKTATPDEVEAKNVALREEIAANTERVQSLAEADNAEGVAELKAETDGLIVQLPTRERNALRKALTAASQAEKAAAPSTEVAPIETPAAPVVVGAEVDALVQEGAQLVRDSAVQKFKSGHAIANVLLKIRTSIILPDGTPDILATSQEAKDKSAEVYTLVTAGLPEEGDENDTDATAAVRNEINSIKRGAQNAMTDARTLYFRELDTAPEEAARFAKVTEGASADQKISDLVAAHYGVELATRSELAKVKRENVKALEAAKETLTTATGALAEAEEKAAEKVAAGEMTEDEKAEALKAAEDAVAAAKAAADAAAEKAGVKVEEDPAEALADAIAKIARLAEALNAKGIAGLDAKKAPGLRKKALVSRDALVALLGNWDA